MKKNPKEYEALTKEFYKVTKEKHIESNFSHYVWDVLIAMSRGYGFNQSHTLSYSLIGLQEMNLAYRFPIIFWNCACLISETGGNEEVEDEEEIEEKDYYNEIEELNEDEENQIVSFYDEEEEDEDLVEIITLKDGKKKKKVKSTNYGKVAAAIGKMQTEGIKIMPPDINKSIFTFSPDIDNNTIIHGLSGITGIGQEIIKSIIQNRPYSSLSDFLKKVKVNKTQAVNLIKSGIFDCFDDREQIMQDYLKSIADTKKVLNLRNVQMLLRENLIPENLDFNRRVFNFNTYIKKSKVDDKYFHLDEIAFEFYQKHFDMDLLSDARINGYLFSILQKDWKKIYTKNMQPIKQYIIDNQEELLKEVNARAIKTLQDKYAVGSISKWEMDSLSFYMHPHELSQIDQNYFGFVDYFSLPDEPIIETTFKKDGKQIPLYKIFRIAGTVLDRDKNKNSVTLLTTKGVVTVKIFGEVFAHYDRRLSEMGVDGKKHVIEKSWFSRGEKIIVTGIRKGNMFIAKKYAKTPFHIVERIIDIDKYGRLTTQKERAEV